MVTWHFQLSTWMASEHFHNCSAYVSVQENSFEWWFHESMLNNRNPFGTPLLVLHLMARHKLEPPRSDIGRDWVPGT